MPLGTAATLIINDKMKAICTRDGSTSYKRQKEQGMIPRGTHCCFGDFPSDMAPNAWKGHKRMQKSTSTPSLCKSASAGPPSL